MLHTRLAPGTGARSRPSGEPLRGGALSREACAKRVREAPSHFHGIASGRSVGSARRSVSREEGRGGHT